MTDPVVLLTMALAGLAALLISAGAALKGWNGWLEIKRLELAGRGVSSTPPAAARIELADLKERVRRLEAIATGEDG